MHYKIRFLSPLVGLLLVTAAHAQTDDFNDNTRGSLWFSMEDDASLTLIEQNQRLEVISTGPASSTTDALYLSAANFRLSTAADFEIAVGFNFSGYSSLGISGNTLSLVFGVGRDLPDGTDSAAVGLTLANFFGAPLFLGTGASRIDDIQTNYTPSASPLNTGVMVISYNASGDDLTLGFEGFGSYNLNDTVQAIWGANELIISLGARGNGIVLNSGDAYFDDFIVRSGTVIPEPASTAIVFALAALVGAVRLRRRHSRVIC